MNEWDWPDWVPDDVREEIEQFWSSSMGRSPDDWRRSAVEHGMPELGQRVRMQTIVGSGIVEGRFVHAWNNIGRIVMDGGAVECVCNSHPLLTLGNASHNWRPL